MSIDEEYLQKAMRALSHDMSSVARAASGFSKLINQQYGQQLDEKALHWLSLIHNEGERAQSKLTRFSAYARLYGIADVEGECCLDSACQAAVASCLRDFPDLKVDIEPLASIRGYARLWELYFYELLSNVAKHVDGAAHVKVSMRVGGDVCRVTVHDSGPGLDGRNLEEAVLPFRVLDPESHQAGMGLAMAKRIADIHNAPFYLESVSQQFSGLRVVVDLPCSLVIDKR